MKELLRQKALQIEEISRFSPSAENLTLVALGHAVLGNKNLALKLLRDRPADCGGFWPEFYQAVIEKEDFALLPTVEQLCNDISVQLEILERQSVEDPIGRLAAEQTLPDSVFPQFLRKEAAAERLFIPEAAALASYFEHSFSLTPPGETFIAMWKKSTESGELESVLAEHDTDFDTELVACAHSAADVADVKQPAEVGAFIRSLASCVHDAVRRRLVSAPKPPLVSTLLEIFLAKRADLKLMELAADSRIPSGFTQFCGVVSRAARRDESPLFAEAMEKIGYFAHDVSQLPVAVLRSKLETFRDPLMDGIVALQQGELHAARDIFFRVATANPQNGAAWCELGHAAATLNEFATAKTALARAEALAGSDLELLNKVGVGYFKLQDIDEAKRVFASIAAKAEYNLEAHNNLAAIAVREGKLDEALGWLNQALRHHSDDVKLKSDIAAITSALTER